MGPRDSAKSARFGEFWEILTGEPLSQSVAVTLPSPGVLAGLCVNQCGQLSPHIGALGVSLTCVRKAEVWLLGLWSGHYPRRVGGGEKADGDKITYHEIKEVSSEKEMSGPLPPPGKLLNIPFSGLHKEDATQGVLSAEGRKAKRGREEVDQGR